MKLAILIMIIAILSLGIGIAIDNELLDISITKAMNNKIKNVSLQFPINPSSPKEKNYGDITFESNGIEYTCNKIENDGQYDINDLQSCFRKVTNIEGKEITNIRNWKGELYKEINIDGKIHRSFDSEKLNLLKEININSTIQDYNDKMADE